jgi:hypothetical protein
MVPSTEFMRSLGGGRLDPACRRSQGGEDAPSVLLEHVGPGSVVVDDLHLAPPDRR